MNIRQFCCRRTSRSARPSQTPSARRCTRTSARPSELGKNTKHIVYIKYKCETKWLGQSTSDWDTNTYGAINKWLMAGTRTSVAPSLTRSARQNTRRNARPNMKRSTSRLVSWISKPRCQYSNVLYTSKWNLSTGCISIVLTRIGSLFLAFENNHKYHCDCNETRW